MSQLVQRSATDMYSLTGLVCPSTFLHFSFHDTWKPKRYFTNFVTKVFWASSTFTVPVDLFNRTKDDGHTRANSSRSSSRLPVLPQLCFTVPEKKNIKINKKYLPGRPIIWNSHMSPTTSTRICHCDNIHSSVWCDTTKLNTVTSQIKINSSDKNRI